MSKEFRFVIFAALLSLAVTGCAVKAGGDSSGVCGGAGDAECAEGYFCEKPAGRCDKPATRGMCKEMKPMCTKEWQPVCGCDGVTYGNDCTRVAAGVSKDHDGECEDPAEKADREAKACGGLGNIKCDEGQFCDMPAGTCGTLNEAGVCRHMTEMCTMEWRPVCGCDGVTYGNDCGRMGAGVSKAKDGECAPAQ